MSVRIRSIYYNMKARCLRPTHWSYYRYGGRGITICEEWMASRSSFASWAMANGYDDNLTLDRRDNSKGYSPENCQWITHDKQMRNTKKNIFITAFGETRCSKDWSDDPICPITNQSLLERIRKGMEPEKAITMMPQFHHSKFQKGHKPLYFGKKEVVA